MMLSAKFPNKPYLRDLDPGVFARYTDYFLGRNVLANEVSGESIDPPWDIVLAYEFACRKEAFLRVREEGHKLKDALEEVIKNSELKDLHFIAPMTLKAKRAPDPQWPNQDRGVKRGKGKDRGSGKGGKGSNNRAAAGGGKRGKDPKKTALAWKTPDGRDICFGYNAGTCSGECSRLHVCRVKGCYKEHPMSAHPQDAS